MPSLPSAAPGSNWLGDEQSYGIRGSSGRVRVSRHLADALACGSKFLIYLVCAPNKSYAIAPWLVISIRPSINTRVSVSFLARQDAWRSVCVRVHDSLRGEILSDVSRVKSVCEKRRNESKRVYYAAIKYYEIHSFAFKKKIPSIKI